MPVLNRVSTADTYADNTGGTKAILAYVYNSRGGWFSVSGAAVFVQLQYGQQGDSHWTEEVEVGDGAFAYLDRSCTGVRFRSAVAGTPAIVTAQIAQGDEPPLSIVALGTVTAVTALPISRQVFTATGAGTYTAPAGVKAILVECISGGGAGGGTGATGVGAAAAGGGGQGGSYAAKLITSPAASYPIVVGAGGTGVNGGSGNQGGSTTFGGVLMGVGGGIGGANGTPTAAFPFLRDGGSGTPATLTGDVTAVGGAGGWGFVGSATVFAAGNGGSGAGAYAGGGGLRGNGTTGPGGAGQPNGGGGAGASAAASQAAQTGGAGGNGIIVVTEFY